MDPRQFVAENRADWEELQGYVGRATRHGLASLSPHELRQLGALHRKVAADLAAARTAYGDARVVEFLNDLALRSHNAVYRAPRRGLRQAARELFRVIPEAACRHTGALFASGLIFFSATLLAALATLADESFAAMVLGQQFIERLQDGEYWIENVFSVIPQSIASAQLLTNNISVALLVYTVGCTGIAPALILFLNGLILGAVMTLCAEYDLMSRFLPFVLTHGLIEISAILVAGAGGLVVFDGWLHPGDRTRLAGFRHGALEGLLVAGAAIPALLIAGPVEAFISPVEQIPGALRILLGVALCLGFWAWLLGPLLPRLRGARDA